MSGHGDVAWRIACAAAGAVVGLRAAQVIVHQQGLSGISSIAGGFTLLGLIVTAGALVGLGWAWGRWRTGSPAPARLAAAAAGLVVACLAGVLLLGAG